MVEVLFNYNGIETIIQCNINDKMKDIINKYIIKTEKNNNNIYYLYNGDKIKEELSFNEQANENDNKRKKMNILVYIKEENINNKENIIKSKDVICPECKENILINIKDYRVNLYECKNNHTKNNISLEEYENTQKIDISKIKCDKCKDKNLGNIFNNEFYICNTCNIKLCPLCKSQHNNNNHNIINYKNKNYICNKHNSNYIKYCKECEENMCILCEKEHKNHNIIYLEYIILEKHEILKQKVDLLNIIDELRNNIEEIKNKFTEVLNTIEIYYKINEDIINNYENKKINYYILKNINEIKENNKKIIKDLNNINNENDEIKTFNYIMNIYDNINYEYKTKKYENGDEYIGEFKNNKRNGKGIIYYNKNDEYKRERYEGEWKNDIFEGERHNILE